MRLLGKAVSVTSGSSGAPSSFYWQRRSVQIRRILDCWREIGCWWDGEKPRTVYLVEGAQGATYELHLIQDAWILAKVYD